MKTLINKIIMVEYRVKEYDDRIEWYNLDGQLNRLDGPAIECKDGDKAWYTDGKFNRLDGPAVEFKNGKKLWYIEDKEYTEAEVEFNNRNKHSCNGTIVEIDGKKYKLKEINT